MWTLLIVVFFFQSLQALCPNNCQFCLMSNTCSLCSPSYALTLAGSCTIDSISNCRVYASSSSCQICEATFILDNGGCKKDTSGCLSRTAEGICQFCYFGTQLSKGSCSGVLNCENYDSTGGCSKCLGGFLLQQGKCQQNRSQCMVKSAGVCSQCRQGYILNGFSCFQSGMIPPNCELFDSYVGYCLVCSQGYEMQHRFCQRLDRISLIGVPNQSGLSSLTSALQMPTDILSDPVPAATESKLVGPDSLIPLDYSVKVRSFSSASNKNSDFCWLKGPDGQCKICWEGYNLFESRCVKLPPSCLKFSADNKTCIECAGALKLNQGACVDANCAVGLFSKCLVCKQPDYSANSEGICMNKGCTAMLAGVCQQCQSGMALTDGKLCTTSTVKPNATASNQLNTGGTTGVQASIKHCLLVVSGSCVSCQSGYFPNGGGGCQRVIIGCLKIDQNQQNCVQCIPGYTLNSDGTCLFPGEAPSAPASSTQTDSSLSTNTVASPSASGVSGVNSNCKIPNNNSCAICQDRYYLNVYNFTCMQVAAECLNYNSTSGECLSCQAGRYFFKGWCLARATQTDPACQISDINNFCIQCLGAYHSYRGTCRSNNPLCRSVQYRGGSCLSCYSGYVLFNGDCIDISKQSACSQYNFQGICQECKNRYYLSAGVCNPVNSLCFGYNSGGNCTSCISGYGVSTSSGLCQEAKPLPANCAKGDPAGNCLQCVSRYFLSNKGSCQFAALLCESFVAVGGRCLACFSGYRLLQDGSCLNESLILGCTNATSQGRCSTCFPQYVLSSEGKCIQRDPNCLKYQGSVCQSCNSLYYIQNGVCLKETPKAKDPNCLINDLYNYCQQCTQGYYISEGNCKLVDQLCRTYDLTSGVCLSCYDGYRLSSGRCYLNSPIFHCQIFNGNVCTECESGYRMLPDGSCAQ